MAIGVMAGASLGVLVGLVWWLVRAQTVDLQAPALGLPHGHPLPELTDVSPHPTRRVTACTTAEAISGPTPTLQGRIRRLTASSSRYPDGKDTL